MIHAPALRWEQGSAYPWMPTPAPDGPSAVPEEAICFDSGRSALTALLRLGQARSGWQRLWVPTYYCPDVVAHLQRTGLQVLGYADTPFRPDPTPPTALHTGDVLLIANHFGLRTAAVYDAFYALGLPIIEDHTHDPWSDWAGQGTSTYSMASYRKTLPVPDGAALWSPAGAPLPAVPPAGSAGAALQLQGMVLKAAYLQHGAPPKQTYLDLFRQAEAAFDAGPVQGMSPAARYVLDTFGWADWRATRQANHDHLAALMVAHPGWKTLHAPLATGVPFAFIGTVPTRRLRDQVRQSLIEQAIYPAILWDLDPGAHPFTDAEAAHAAGRMLSLHCDGRYTAADLLRVADALQAALQG